LGFVDAIEDAESADPIAPRFGNVTSEFFDIPTETRLDAELGVNVLSEFDLHE